MYMQHAPFAIMPPYPGLSGLACSTLNPIDWGQSLYLLGVCMCCCAPPPLVPEQTNVGYNKATPVDVWCGGCGRIPLFFPRLC